MPVPPPNPRPIKYREVYEVGYHSYRALYVPEGCETYVVDQVYTLSVNEPPASPIVIAESGPCNGTVMVLDE